MACPATPTGVIPYSVEHFCVPGMMHSPKPTIRCLCRFLANTRSYVPRPSYGSLQGGSRAIPAEYRLVQERVSKRVLPTTHNHPGDSAPYVGGNTVTVPQISRCLASLPQEVAQLGPTPGPCGTIAEVMVVVSNCSRVRTTSAGTGDSSRIPGAGSLDIQSAFPWSTPRRYTKS